MNFVTFFLLLILFIWLGVLSVKYSTRGRRFFWTVLGVATTALIMSFVFIDVFEKVSAPIFIWLLFLTIAVGLFLAIMRFRLW